MSTLEELAKAAHAARSRLEMFQYQNVYGLTEEQAQSRAVSYAKARRECWLAEQALEAAIKAPPDEVKE